MHYLARMTEPDVDRFRKEANECRMLGAAATTAIDKESWLRLAGEWQKLAEEAAKRPRQPSPLREWGR